MAGVRAGAALLGLALVGCGGSSQQPTSRIVVVVTIDWEGAYISIDGLDAIDRLRTELSSPPVTHFVSSAYFTKPDPDPTLREMLQGAVRAGDEVAVHLHLWASLVRASGFEPRNSPSFLSGTDQLLDVGGGDVGYDVDPDAYSVSELRSVLRTSRALLEKTTLRVSRSFRAGGALGTQKVLRAIAAENYVVDSSASNPGPVGSSKTPVFGDRLKQVWPKLDGDSLPQPFLIASADSPSPGPIVELPITLSPDYLDGAKLLDAIEAASARLAQRSDHHVYVVVALEQETAHHFTPRLAEAWQQVRDRRELVELITFTTVEQAAEIARNDLGSPR